MNDNFFITLQSLILQDLLFSIILKGTELIHANLKNQPT